MDDQQPAIIVKDLYKSFRLPHEQHSGLKQVILNIAKRKKGYEVQHVLDDVSFEIKKGEFFGIVGRNGSGKSTLLKILAGTYTPDKGVVHVNGSLTPFIELGVGFNPELTGRENIFLNGALLGFSHSEMEAMYEDIVAFAELEKFMDQKLKNYSSGMQVRLAFSIAVRAKSDILILDEVLAVGDEAFQKKCINYFRELKDRKQTVVLVTHDMASVERFCDRVMVLNQGENLGIFSTREAQAIYKQLNVEQTTNYQNIYATKKRWGSQEYTISKITINGIAAGNGPIKIKKGAELNIQLDIGSNTGEYQASLVVGLGFHDDDGTYIAGPNSKDTNSVIANFAEYTVESTPLNPGVYTIETALTSKDEKFEFDHMTNAASIEVYDDASDNFGKIDLLGKWSVKNEKQN